MIKELLIQQPYCYVTWFSLLVIILCFKFIKSTSLFCRHKWIEKERHRVERYRLIDNAYGGEGVVIIQECEKCGKLKKVSFP